MEFHNLSFDTEIDDMDEEEVRATLAEFMEKHTENVASFNDLMQKVEEAEAGDDENAAEFEALQGEVSDFKGKFAESLADRVPLTEEELMQFSLSRLYEMDEATAVPADDQPEEGEFEEEPEQGLEDKPSKAGNFSEDDDAVLRARATERLSRIPGLSFE